MIRIYLDAVFRHATEYVPIRILTEKGMPAGVPWSEFALIGDDFETTVLKAAQKAAHHNRALYLVPGTVERAGSAKAADIVQTPVLLIDVDEGDISAMRDHLISHLGKPTLEVASGGKTEDGQDKRHLYWRLTESATGADIPVVEYLRSEIAAKVGGDPSFGSIHQTIRVAGSVHCKHGKRTLVRIIDESDLEYDLGDLADLVAQMPTMPGLAQQNRIATNNAKAPFATELMTRRIREGGVDGVTRFDAISSVIGHWIRQIRCGRASLEDAWAAAVDYNTAMIVPPWEVDRLRREFDALLRHDIAEKGPMLGQGAPVTSLGNSLHAVPPAFSEDAFAAAFVELQGHDWKFVTAFGTWMHWTGCHWQRDTLGAVRESVRLVCRAQALAHDKSGDARRIASDKTISAVVRLAASDPQLAMKADTWDVDPMLLNTPGGIVNLVTGEIEAHDRSCMMTQMTGASPGPGSPRWERFLQEVTDGDADVIAYLQRVCGYCLTGSTQEQVFFFLHGDGANGKSVFLRTLSSVLGTYATTAPLETFTASHVDRHPTDLAGLKGARLVAVAETDAGRFWAETRIKTITGGDPIKARFMHRDFFEFRPTFKLLVAGNHRPRLKGVGEAMRRRMHFVPFTVIIPVAQRDKTLEAQLVKERDGILTWMLQGCAEWQRIGLAPPAKVSAAAEEYFADEDVVGQWIAAQCVIGADLTETTAALFASWSQFADGVGLEKGSQQTLGEALRQRGFTPRRTSTARGWAGIGLRRGGSGQGSQS